MAAPSPRFPAHSRKIKAVLISIYRIPHTMTVDSKNSLAPSLEAAAAKVGLTVVSVEPSLDLGGNPTAVFCLALHGQAEHTLKLTLSKGFDLNAGPLADQMDAHLSAAAKRLRNPRPDCVVTLGGLPVALGGFQWPLHSANSGSDAFIVHGEATLADGVHELRAKIATAVSQTFAGIIPAMEQPYAESFVLNALRKGIDLGQIEFIKSGTLQPVQLTTRYYSHWKKTFVFTDSTPESRLNFLLSKVYWLSGVLGASQPVWIADPRDAQYLNATPADLLSAASAAGSLFKLDGDFAAATPELLARAPQFEATRDAALNFTKPQFSESMRSGQANM